MEVDLRKIALTGEQAQFLKASPALKTALDVVRLGVIEDWANTKPGAEGMQAREDLFRDYHATTRIVKQIDVLIDDGAVALRQLQHEQRMNDMRENEVDVA